MEKINKLKKIKLWLFIFEYLFLAIELVLAFVPYFSFVDSIWVYLAFAALCVCGVTGLIVTVIYNKLKKE